MIGSVRRRFFRAAGSTMSRTDVVAGEVIATCRRRAVSRALSAVLDQYQYSQRP